jgi:RNA polymerase sigma-70 factor (ECF subfamily)
MDSGLLDRTVDQAHVDRLRAGDEAAFRDLVRTHHQAMLQVARLYVPSDAIAEEVVQETWLAVVRGLDGFEGRSSLKTWIFRILVNRAKTRGVQERRAIAFSTLVGDPSNDEPDADTGVERLFNASGNWRSVPRPFDLPHDRFAASQVRAQIGACIDRLPPRQRTVIVLRDVAGWTAAEVRHALGISDANQRVLLHRARTKARAALEQALAELWP